MFSNRGGGHPLTALGQRQARQLGMRLAGRGVGTIHSSPMTRAIQTAELISAFIGARIQVTEALREQDAGRLEGRSDPEGWRLYAEVLDDWLLHERFRSRLPEGETFGDIANRFLPFVRDLVAIEESALLIGHRAHLVAMLPLITSNLDPAELRRLPFPNCGLVHLERRADGLVCNRWGSRWVAKSTKAAHWRSAAWRAI